MSEARAIPPDSIEITLVVFDAGFLEKPDQLLAERFHPMMFLLIGNVLFHRIPSGCADGKGGVAFLPMEGRQMGFANP